MKKSLIALAALATVATAAQAQSSVTIYGVVDMGYASVSGVATGATTTAGAATSTVRGLQNGGGGTSRLGFKGTEDLGGGLKAGFTLEAEFLGDTGSTKSSAEALFNRESSVSLGGSFGEVKLGRYNSFSYAQGAKFDPFGGNNLGGYIATGLYGHVRLENAVQYVSPTVSGVTFAVQSGTRTTKASYPGTTQVPYGEVAGETSGNRNTGAMLSFANGPLELAATYGEQKAADGIKLDDVTTLFARYSFGTVKLVAGYMKQDIAMEAGGSPAVNSDGLDTGDNQKVTNTFLGANVALSSNLTLNAIAGQVEYDRKASTKQKPKYYAAGLTYSLSKRTSLYGIVAQSKQDNDSALAIASTSKFSYSNSAGTDTGGMVPVANKDQTAYMIGVRHNF